jgi:hypothetical protein
MKPSAYKHIAAWCRANQLGDDGRRALQRFASATNAPVDALYYTPYTRSWVTIASCGSMTRRSVETELNRGPRK